MLPDLDPLHRREESGKNLPHCVQALNAGAEWTFEGHIGMKRRGADILRRQGAEIRIDSADHFFAHLWPPKVSILQGAKIAVPPGCGPANERRRRGRGGSATRSALFG